MQRTYIAIDLKSYYASVECMERGLDPMTTNPNFCTGQRNVHKLYFGVHWGKGAVSSGRSSLRTPARRSHFPPDRQACSRARSR